MRESRLTRAGRGAAFTQFLCQFGHFAAYWFVATQETIFRDGVVLWSTKWPIIILLRERKRREERDRQKKRWIQTLQEIWT